MMTPASRRALPASSDARELTVLVVSHTHWDREWYHAAEEFRLRLVALVDELLDEPATAETSFLLDGQGVLLEDYLEVRPERAPALRASLAGGRIEAGPWYVLADELIPGGEALVRNLLAGRDVVRRHGGEPPPVLYCPDSFGHPAILPELAQGFGCEVIVLWRGYGGARWPAGDTVRWRGPSGVSALLHHLPPDGYEFGGSLPTDPEAAHARWGQLSSVLAPRATCGVALLLNGADHHARQRRLAEALDALAGAAAPATVRPSSLRAAAAAIERAATGVALPEVRGELRDSYGYTWTLGGTLATRASQKRDNALVERMLVRDTEPWVALSAALPRGGALLSHAWRTLLRAHPHDTLCGTSIDVVAAAFDQRVAQARSLAGTLRADAIGALLAHDADDLRHRQPEWRPALVLRNPAARARGGVAEVILRTTLADVAVGPGSAKRQGIVREPADGWEAAWQAQPLSRSRVVALTEAPRAYPDADLVEEVRALVWADRLGGYEVRTTLAGEPMPAQQRVVTADRRSLDNGLLRVVVEDAGTVLLTDLATGHAVRDLLGLELQRDVGDLYTPAIREALEPMRYAGCGLVHRGPLRGELALSYEDASGPGTLTVRLQLDAGLGALRVGLEGWNARPDARTRVRVATGAGGAAATLADAAFHSVARGSIVATAGEAETEQVVPTAPLHRWVSRSGAARGATVFSDGLAEYQSLADGAVAITLVRSVGTLSRHDLPERPGHAGWPAETPGAQSQGPWAARLAVALHGPDTPAQRDAIERIADDVLVPLTGELLRSNVDDGRTVGGLELEGGGLAFSAAMPAREAGWIALRCVNRRDQVVQGRWRLARPVSRAVRARLDETPGEELVVSGSDIAFTAAPMEIVTVLARFGQAAQSPDGHIEPE